MLQCCSRFAKFRWVSIFSRVFLLIGCAATFFHTSVMEKKRNGVQISCLIADQQRLCLLLQKGRNQEVRFQPKITFQQVYSDWRRELTEFIHPFTAGASTILLPLHAPWNEKVFINRPLSNRLLRCSTKEIAKFTLGSSPQHCNTWANTIKCKCYHQEPFASTWTTTADVIMLLVDSFHPTGK